MSATLAAFPEMPSWLLMWALAAALFYTGKASIWITAPAAQKKGGFLRNAGWWLAWPGMSLKGWHGARHAAPLSQVATLCIEGTRNILLGAGLLWGFVRIFEHPLVAGWAAMVSILLILHFGVFHLSAAFWLGMGVKVKPVMRNPLASTSLAEFWGERWNTAFRDLAHRLLFLPAARRWGEAAATWTVFLVSGLAHEVVISVPAGAGYGLPTAYFLIQAAGLLIERRYCTLPRTIKRVRTVLFTALPAFFLFHPPFMKGVMVPFLNAIGALG